MTVCRTLAFALGILLAARPGWSQPCHPMTPDLRAAIDRVERFLDEVDQPQPVRASDMIADRTRVTVGGLDVHVLGRTSDERASRLRASVRRIASKLDAAIAQLGPDVGQRPVYLVPFDSSSYDLPRGGTTLAETRCYDQETPVYGTVDDPAVPGRACVVVVFVDVIPADDELDFALAHEWFHSIQHGTFSNADHTCRSAWWREGAADWFAHHVVETAARTTAIKAFFERMDRTPLIDFSYEAQVFHLWAERRFGAPWVFQLGRRTDAQLSSAADVGATIDADAWRAWAEAVADGTITYPDGRPLPGLPARPMLHTLPPSGTLALEGPPLAVQIHTATVQSTGTYTVTYAPGGALLATSPVSDSPIAAAWTRIAPDGETRTLDGDCARPSQRIVALATTGRPLSATMRSTSEGGGACDACYYGTWEEEVERTGVDLELPGPAGRVASTTVTGPHQILVRMREASMRRTWAGAPVLTVLRDGTYTLDDARTTSMLAPDGSVFQESVDTTYRESGTWTPLPNGRVEVRRQRRETGGTLRVMTTTQPYSEDRRLRGSPVRYVPLCSAGRLELWLPPMLDLRAQQQRAPSAEDEPARPARVFARRTP